DDVLRAPAAGQDGGVRRLRQRRSQPVAPLARRRSRCQPPHPRVVRSLSQALGDAADSVASSRIRWGTATAERAESAEIICPASAGLASWTRLRVLRARRGCLPSRESDSHHGDGVWAFNVLYFASAASISDDSERKTPYCCSVGA